MKIAILGTRGIPNQYGGFEQFAEYLAVGLKERGHEVAVYLPHFHPYTEDTFRSVRLHRIYSPEHRLGAAGNFLYDFLCLRDAVKRGYDIALECGYGTASISYYLCRFRKTRVITNMDGLEWKRAKWSPLVQGLMRRFEAMAVHRSHALVADNPGIQTYLKSQYGVDSVYIPYGAEVVDAPPVGPLAEYQLEPGGYFLAIARLEPENNLEMLIEGYRKATIDFPLIIIGNHQTPYGEYLQNRCRELPGVRFLGAIYQKPVLDALRHHARIYLHGHSVGGTNPSLLEAMGSGAFIAAHDNPFNQGVLQENALYFATPDSLSNLYCIDPGLQRRIFCQANRARILHFFNWPQITEQYENLFRLQHSSTRGNQGERLSRDRLFFNRRKSSEKLDQENEKDH